ncbi:hypothetical protein CLCR_11115 [Cladophialophora carrionii]|uniref:Uncharacterized protein n=1 Tax=Cladophialophora carrionii TaxID=86049 RepID=A0A1C1CVK5_9EURO|nr:hypothetical protein CLCR_11115 [Cladophialophora carrionii]
MKLFIIIPTIPIRIPNPTPAPTRGIIQVGVGGVVKVIPRISATTTTTPASSSARRPPPPPPPVPVLIAAPLAL